MTSNQERTPTRTKDGGPRITHRNPRGQFKQPPHAPPAKANPPAPKPKEQQP